MTTRAATRTTKANSVSDESTTRRVAESAHGLIDETAARAEDVERQIREKAAVAGDKLDATRESANEQVEQSLARVEKFVKDKPMTAAGIAFAAGIVATSLLRR